MKEHDYSNEESDGGLDVLSKLQTTSDISALTGDLVPRLSLSVFLSPPPPSRIFSYLDVVTLCRCAQVSKVSSTPLTSVSAVL